jgi:hypothetical protein
MSDFWYKYRMEVMFNGEWREVGISGDRNQARSILNQEYGGRRDFRIKEAMTDQVIDFHDRNVRTHGDGAARIAQFYANLQANDVDRFRREIMGEWASQNEPFIRNIEMNDRIRNRYESQYQRLESRFQARQARLDHFNFVNARPEPQPPMPFVGILAGSAQDTFTKVSEPREKVNWKEEGF